jgi:putative NIF3 family GTP cyclohydrolase 1 type 2
VAGISTEELMQIALELAGMRQMPADSAVYVSGDGLQRVLAGIDIGPAELLIARELGCDGVLAHHPAGGSATLRFPEVLTRHIDLMVEYGVPREVARQAVGPLVSRAVLRAQAANYDHAPSFARLLGLPFLNIHLPLDELGRRIMVAAIDRHVAALGREAVVQDVIDALLTLPEFAGAPTAVMVPVGAVDRPAGKVAVVHGAGTNGGAAVAKAYFDHGVSTVVYIHIAPEEAERLRAETRGNLVVAGHIAADRIGINRYLAELEARGLEVVRASGV